MFGKESTPFEGNMKGVHRGSGVEVVVSSGHGGTCLPTSVAAAVAATMVKEGTIACYQGHRPLDLFVAGCEHALHRVDLGRVDAGGAGESARQHSIAITPRSLCQNAQVRLMAEATLFLSAHLWI